jgi:hypothetical protein
MENDLKSEYVQFRASVPEARLLEMLSMHLGLSHSETMRKLIREAAQRSGLPDPQELETDPPFVKREVTHAAKAKG